MEKYVFKRLQERSLLFLDSGWILCAVCIAMGVKNYSHKLEDLLQCGFEFDVIKIAFACSTSLHSCILRLRAPKHNIFIPLLP